MNWVINNRRIRRSHGFTLMEILLVVCLISVIGLAVFQSLANGIKVWKYSLRYDTQEDVAIAFDKFGHDLRNNFRYSAIPGEGDSTRFSFPTFIRTPADKNIAILRGEIVDQIGKVQYYFDPVKSGFYRRQANYSQAVKKNKFGPERLLVPSVVSVKFSYYYETKGRQEIKNKVEENNFPIAVRVDLELREDSGSKRMISRLFDVPRKMRE